MPPLSTPELDVLRLTARSSLGEPEAAAFREAVANDLDWPHLLYLAQYHRLAPLLFAHLLDHADAPEGILALLRDHVRRQSAHVLFLSSEMARIAERLEAEGILYLVLKGPSLAMAYGSIAKRPFVDNDVLVRRADFARVKRALSDLGFQARRRGSLQQAGYLLVHGEDTFRRAAGAARSTVDVHTTVVPFGFAYAPSLPDLLSRSRQIGVGGATVPVLGWEDLFLTLSVNALKDQWSRLRLASDIAAVGAMVGDWDAVIREARRLGSVRAMHLALLIAADEVSGVFPADVLLQARLDHRAAALSQMARSVLEASDGRHAMAGAARIRLHLLVQDQLQGQVRYAGFSALRRLTERWVDPEQ